MIIKLTVLTSLLLAIILGSTSTFASQPLSIQINGTAVAVPSGTHVVEGQVLLPIRWAAEQMGAYSIEWNPKTHNIDIKTNEDFYIIEKLASYFNGLELRSTDKEAEMWPLPDRIPKITLPHIRDIVLVLEPDSWIRKMNTSPQPFLKSPASITVINDIQSYSWPFAVNYLEEYNDHIYVTMDWLELLFYADVNYNKAMNQLTIQTPDLKEIEQQIAMIENLLVPATPEEAMQLWGRGEQTRSGALQYAVLSPELRQQADNQYIITQSGWVTGGSSPWVGPITVKQKKRLDNTAMEYTVTFPEVTSVPPNLTATEKFVVRKITVNGREGWFISEMLQSSAYGLI